MDKEIIKEKMHELEKLLNYNFKSIDFLSDAMCSQKLENTNENGKNHTEYSNESLSFLGDTIIKFLISNHLYGDGKNKRKGSMSIEKSKLEKNETFHKIMTEENLISFAYNEKHFYKTDLPKHEKVVSKNHDPYIEAIAAAIYKDGGFENVTIWFENWLLPRLFKYCNNEK